MVEDRSTGGGRICSIKTRLKKSPFEIMNWSGSRTIGKLMRIKCYRVGGCVMISLVFILVIDISGVLRHVQERSFETDFSYPLESAHFAEIVDAFRLGKEVETPPINTLYSSFHISAKGIEKCIKRHHLTLVILVKSAPPNFKQRQAIRETWKIAAAESNAKTMFFIGNPKLNDEKEKDELTKALNDEANVHKDIIRLAFDDSYYNNTIKTMLEMRWAVKACPNFDYALLVDDDYFVSVKNLLKFIQNPAEYPEKVRKNGETEVAKLYAGYRMFPPPHRHKIMTKWFVPLEEYPYDYFPPYITAGAILLSKSALFDIHFASYFTAHFRFDDVYVAICAKKMNVTPIHSNYFRFWSTSDESPEAYLIASHGFSDSERLHRFWKIQKTHGYC